jgi:hypothetical protein
MAAVRNESGISCARLARQKVRRNNRQDLLTARLAAITASGTALPVRLLTRRPVPCRCESEAKKGDAIVAVRHGRHGGPH